MSSGHCPPPGLSSFGQVFGGLGGAKQAERASARHVRSRWRARGRRSSFWSLAEDTWKASEALLTSRARSMSWRGVASQLHAIRWAFAQIYARLLVGGNLCPYRREALHDDRVLGVFVSYQALRSAEKGTNTSLRTPAPAMSDQLVRQVCCSLWCPIESALGQQNYLSAKYRASNFCSHKQRAQRSNVMYKKPLATYNLAQVGDVFDCVQLVHSQRGELLPQPYCVRAPGSSCDVTTNLP